MIAHDQDLETREHYRDPEVAHSYHELARGRGAGLLGGVARVVTGREIREVGRALDAVLRGGRARTLLDVPSGAGKLAPLLETRARRVVFADASPAMLALGSSPARVVAEAAALPFPNGAFDVVVCLRLLHRVSPVGRDAILGELARVSARAVIASFGIVGAWQRLRLAARSRILGSSPVLVACTTPEAEAHFERAGLTVTRRAAILPGLSAEWIFTAEKS